MTHPQPLTPDEMLTTALDRITDTLDQLDAPKTITICGSTRYLTEMEAADIALTWTGHIVLPPPSA